MSPNLSYRPELLTTLDNILAKMMGDEDWERLSATARRDNAIIAKIRKEFLRRGFRGRK